MVEWRQAGVIVNPVAGISTQESLRAARRVAERLGAIEILTGPATLGAEAFAGWSGRLHVCVMPIHAGQQQTQALAHEIASHAIDGMIVVGGDGTLADVSRAFLNCKLRTPILGVGAGSTNVGRLITCRAERAEYLKVEELEAWDVDCLLVSVNGQPLALGFNDVVVGHTIVGMLNGRRRDLDAVERISGNLIPGKPRSAGCSSARVTRRSSDNLDLVIAQGTSVATVVVGFADSSFFGKAVTGGICLATVAGLPAGCIVSDTPLVQIEIDAGTLRQSEPVTSRYASLANSDSIVIEGVASAALCADGNPCRRLESTDQVFVSVHCDAVVGVRKRKDLRSA
jgi:NAD kinase